jgi:hypothetical protein
VGPRAVLDAVITYAINKTLFNQGMKIHARGRAHSSHWIRGSAGFRDVHGGGGGGW